MTIKHHTHPLVGSLSRWLLAAAVAVLPIAASAQNAVVNGSFDTDLSGWMEEEWDLANANWSSQDHTGGSSGSFRATQQESGGILSHFDAGAQCVPVNPDLFYDVTAWLKLRPDNEENGQAYLYIVPIHPGQPCPAPVGDDVRFGFDRWLANAAFRFEFADQNDQFFVREALEHVRFGTDQVRVSLAIYKDGVLGDGDRQFGAYFDDVVVTPSKADLASALAASTNAARPGEPFTLTLSLANGQGNAAQAPELQVRHNGRLQLLDHSCPGGGSVVDAFEGTQKYFLWFGQPAIAGGAQRTCTLTVALNPGAHSGVNLLAFPDCANCDRNPANDASTLPVDKLPAPDGAVDLAVTPFPALASTTQATLSLSNVGNAAANFSILLEWQGAQSGESGTLPFQSSNCPELSGSTGQAQGSVHLAAGASRSCTLVYAWPSDIGEDQRATVFIHNSDDFIEGNDQATAVSRLARLRVNRTHDAGDRVPGDGDCDASNTGAGDCTLRAAIMEANALPGRQVVELPWSASSYAITSISGDDDQLKGDLDLHGAITLLGEPHASGPRPVIALMLPPAQRDRAIDSDGTVRIEQVEIRGQGLAIAEDGGLLRARGNALILRDVLLRDGATLGSGGAVHAESRLTLERVQVLDSQAARGGGLAFVPDGMPIADITDALFEGNTATGSPGEGGAFWSSAGLIGFIGSTLHDNTAQRGGGIALQGSGTGVILRNSTVSGNQAALEGGGLWLDGAGASIESSTIANNAAAPGDASAGLGGGIWMDNGGSASLHASLVAGNTAQTRPAAGPLPIGYPHAAACYGTLSTSGYNLLQTVSTDLLCTFTATTGDLPGATSGLQPLADNGGPTPTHAIASTSLAVDAGDPDCAVDLDQRGAPRPTDGDGDGSARCDIGAYEHEDAARIVVTRSGAGSGTVTSKPAGISCGFSCEVPFALDSQVTLTATAASGSRFAGWSGACSGTGPCTVTADGTVEVDARFDAAVADVLFVDLVAGNGAGGRVLSTPSGIDCPGSCSAAFAIGTSVSLAATVDPGSIFLGFFGEGCNGATGPCTVAMDGGGSVQALFDAVESDIAVTVAGNGVGRVVSTPGGIDCPGGCGASFPITAQVTLRAQPAVGSTFSGWSGACSGTGNCVLEMDQGPHALTASFGQGADALFHDGFE